MFTSAPTLKAELTNLTGLAASICETDMAYCLLRDDGGLSCVCAIGFHPGPPAPELFAFVETRTPPGSINSRPLTAYAAIPFGSDDGGPAGTIAVASSRPGAELSERQISCLRQIALQAHYATTDHRFLHWHRLVADHLPALIAYWDVNERCCFANNTYFEWFGVPNERMIGISLREVLGEDVYAKNLPFIRGALAGEVQRFERVLKKKIGGADRHVDAMYIPDTRAGVVHGFFVLVVDVNERKSAEIEAVKAREKALAASQVKSRFLAHMSHEIRTPMNGVLGMLALALDTELSSAQREYLEAARQSASHLLSLIDDILDLSKIEAGGLVIHAAPFRLRETLESALRALLVKAERKGLATELLIDPGVPAVVIGDSVRVRQVLINLVSNAVKYTARGKVVVRVSSSGANRLSFTVTDTGLGIPKDKLGAIFAPFTQVGGGSTREYGGAGLGLAISRELVQLMGGTLDVESEMSRGSSFRFTLSLPAANLVDEPQVRPRVEVADGRRLNVLMAEDDPISALVQLRMLEKLSCEVVHVRDGAQAIEAMMCEDFDLVLMDMQMPLMDGPTAVRKIRIRHPAVPIYALTANAMDEDRVTCMRAGMTGYIPKPVQLEKLAQLLSTIPPTTEKSGLELG